MIAVLLVHGLAFGQVSADVDFNRDVRPILSDKCFFCHGPDPEHREADLRLDQEVGIKADLGGYRAVVPGDVEASELIYRVTADDEYERMPPAESGKHLSDDEIETLKQWVRQGAPWSRHWAYQSPVRHAVPEVADVSWPINWIDNFILANLEAHNLPPSPMADPTTLVRRLHFDLVGLPPEVADAKRFVSAARGNPTAYARHYERHVDRLLDSPHFGERMAMYWLDLVRYADTVGYHGDQDHNISPYRDYVIDAFNRNLPFDQFTREQLAGDLLVEPNTDQIVATGYNRLLQTSHEGGVQPKEYNAIYAADRVRNVSMVWMGGTLGCAQCHDHKYDPYTSRDFYSMAAFFADVDDEKHFKVGSNALPTKRPPEIAVLSRREREKARQIKRRLSKLKERRITVEGKSEQAELESQIDELEARLTALRVNKRVTMVTVSLEKPRVTRILPRGNWLDDSGPIVQPAVPQFLGSVQSDQQRATRLDLANWLTDPDHGSGLLTARVFVNRIWYLLFGEGLARSLDDFGAQGVPPDHPELLDQLAVDFVENGWDIKRLVKTIVMSRTYRQSSLGTTRSRQVDPENRWLSRQRRFRLPAEMVRDNALAVSGLLVRDIGGVSVKPYQPAGYYRHLNFPKRTYQADEGRQQWRRGVYVHWQRQFLHPTLLALDAPSREECTAQRARSNTPLAALALLNDPTFVEAARVFAQRILCQHPDATFTQRLNAAFQRALSRQPDSFEVKRMKELYGTALKRFQQHPEEACQLVDVGLAEPADDVSTVQLAAWASVTRALLNLHETISRL